MDNKNIANREETGGKEEKDKINGANKKIWDMKKGKEKID